MIAAGRQLVGWWPRRQLAGRVVFGVLSGGICYYFGADVWWSFTIGLAVLVLGVAVLARPAHRGVRWPSPAAPDRTGTRSDVVELSWSLRTRYGRVGLTALSRLQRLARSRLAQRQLDLRRPADRAAIEELLGRGVYRLLTSNQVRRPTLRAYVRCLDVLDALDAPSSTAPRPADRSRPRHGSWIQTVRRNVHAR